MSRARRLLFAAVTLMLLVVAVEGGARIFWWHLETKVFDSVRGHGEAQLASVNKAVYFMYQPDGVFGYVLQPGLSRTRKDGTRQVLSNSAGFAQIEEVPRTKSEGELRVVAMGESTTHGFDVEAGNYPVRLKRLIETNGTGYSRVSMINAGVSGWLSDQLALQAERKLVDYKPDVVLLYAGWNDFQTYDPFSAPPAKSWFSELYGDSVNLRSGPFTSLVLANALYLKALRDIEGATETYRRDRSQPVDRKPSPPVAHGQSLFVTSGIEELTAWKPLGAQAVVERHPETDQSQFRISEDGTRKTSHGIFQLFTVAEGQRYALSILVKPVTVAVQPRSVERDLTIAAGGRGGSDFLVEFDLENFGIKKRLGRINGAGMNAAGNGWYRAWVVWSARASETVPLNFQLSIPGEGRIYDGVQGKSVLVKTPHMEQLDQATFEVIAAFSGDGFGGAVEDTYRFYLANLDRTVAAYRKTSPTPVIVLSTLVGRWPMLTDSQFASELGGPGWMRLQNIDQKMAAQSLIRFNDLIRDYAKRNGLLLVDPAKDFADLDLRPVFDRGSDYGDYLHMLGDGYELLSEFFYEALRKEGVVTGSPSPRLEQLYKSYSQTRRSNS